MDGLTLADTHVHLLSGLDDGPRSDDEALAMCRMLVAEGVRTAAATAHWNPEFLENDPPRILAATDRLKLQLREANIPLTVVPTAEVVMTDDLVERFQTGSVLTIGNAGKYLLVEMPHTFFLDYLPVALALKPLGVRVVVAHAERYEPLLNDPALAEHWIAAGCLMQFTTEALADPPGNDGPVMKLWAQRGMIHVLGSDGHRIDRRKPEWKAGYAQLKKWIGATAAERIGSIWGTAVLQGLPVNPPPPKKRETSWFSRLFG